MMRNPISPCTNPQRHKVHTPPPVPLTAQELALVDTHHALVNELLLHHDHSVPKFSSTDLHSSPPTDEIIWFKEQDGIINATLMLKRLRNDLKHYAHVLTTLNDDEVHDTEQN